ncbi:MAG: hypothetical protein LLG44_05745 [Chloroflexi bacterium]|nr:hypothetical protein [Chloroflexota bacterium]
MPRQPSCGFSPLHIKHWIPVFLAFLLVSSTGCSAIIQPKVDAAVQATLTAIAPTATPEATPTPELTCSELTSQWLAEIGPLVREWDDALAVANSTARISLANPVKDLQRISRSLEEAPAPECAQQAKTYYINYVNAEIDVFIKFMAQEYTDAAMMTASDNYAMFQAEIRNLTAD